MRLVVDLVLRTSPEGADVLVGVWPDQQQAGQDTQPRLYLENFRGGQFKLYRAWDLVKFRGGQKKKNTLYEYFKYSVL